MFLFVYIYCHQAPGRAWRLRELAGEVRESGGSESQLCLVFDSFSSLFNSFKHAFRHDGKHSNRTYVHYNVTAIPSLRCVRYPGQ